MLKGTVHEYRRQFKSRAIYKNISKDNEVKDTFEAFNSKNVNIVDVEYEEIK
ncbi:MAG: hypothetical protein Q8930_11040 [Bacillota bacterium]|nr:hypothetical protein [Bacillota bacterium]